MTWVWVILGAALSLALLLAGAAVLNAALGAARASRGMAAQLARSPAARGRVPADLPPPVRAFARRNGARPGGRRARLSQAAEMVLRPGAPWQPVPARQEIALGVAGFVWRAQVPLVGRVPRFSVLDAFVAGRGRLLVRLLGLVPLAHFTGPDIDRGEAMRYLAELPWAPDAILGNPALRWSLLEDGRVKVRLGEGPVAAEVTFTLDAQGDIVSVFAPDRPATGPDGRATPQPWQGHFFHYVEMGGRRIPSRAEVGHVQDGVYAPYFRCRIIAYEVE